MPLTLAKLYTLPEIAAAINQAAGTEIVSLRTLEDVVRDLGYARGRGKKRAFKEEDALIIQEAVACRLSTPRELASGTGAGPRGASSKAGSTSLASRRRETEETLRRLGQSSPPPSSGNVSSLETARKRRKR